MYLFQKQAWHSFWAGKHLIQKKHILFWLPTFFSCIWNFNDQVQLQTSSTLFNIDCYLQLQLNKNSNYNRLACKIANANLGSPVKIKIKWKERTVLHASTGYDHYSIRAALSVNVISMCNQMLSSGSRELTFLHVLSKS